MSTFEDNFEKAIAAAKALAKQKGTSLGGLGNYEEMVTQLLGDAAYAERHKFPKWNIPVTVLKEPRLMKRVHPFYTMSKEVHAGRAAHFSAKAKKYSAEHKRVAAEAEKKHGWKGPLISGVLQEHWPENVKENLRFLGHGSQIYKDAARAHHAATGARNPLRIED
jgi:hypothetical protein